MQLPQHSAEDLAAPAGERKGGRDQAIAAHAHVEGAVTGFVEAVRRVPVRGVDCDAVAEGLEGEGGVEDEALGAADAEVGVEEDDVAAARGG